MTLRPAATLLLLALTSACSRSPQTTADAIPQAARGYSTDQEAIAAFFAEYRQRVEAPQREGNLAGEVALVRELRARFAASPAVQDITSQLLGTYASFLGQYAEAHRYLTRGGGAPAAAPPDERTAELLAMEAVPAASAIFALADTARAIFINEAHHVPQHRVLPYQVLDSLYRLGFRYLAAETLAESDSALNSRRYPVRGSGYYSFEPVFGEMLREAQRIGYTLVAYEAVNPASTEERERGQATNLYQRVFQRDVAAKVLVFAGYSHIHESGTDLGTAAMAARFRELSGINPVTIDQTVMTERHERGREHPLFTAIADARQMPGAIVLLDRQRRPWSFNPAVYDVTVFSPRSQLDDFGRPHWLHQAGRRTAWPIPVRACGGDSICVVAARREAESEDAVPADRLEFQRGRRAALLLPAGRYLIEARNEANRLVGSWRAEVG